jgi:long-chain acyl-CoA synthetase
VKGMNVMLGYYKNKTATDEVLTHDGWLRTGDLGVMDEAQNLTIRGRSKNMLLGSSGQNIYPEEIEEKLNTLPYVAESIVTQQEGKIVALIHPDYALALEQGLSAVDMNQQMEVNRKTLNMLMPHYSQVASVKIYSEEFEKTPKRSIKRYLYI